MGREDCGLVRQTPGPRDVPSRLVAWGRGGDHRLKLEDHHLKANKNCLWMEKASTLEEERSTLTAHTDGEGSRPGKEVS